MLRRVRRVGEYLERKRAAAELSRPLTYAGVVRYLFWQTVPVLGGPLVILAYQFAVNGTTAAVVFGSGVGMFALSTLGAVAQLRDRTIDTAVFAAGWLALTGGAAAWAVDAGLSGIGAWIVGFFGFTSLVAAAAVSVGLKNQLRED